MSKPDPVKAIFPGEPVESKSDGFGAPDGDGDHGFVERRKAAGEQRLAAEATALARLHAASTRLWQIRDLGKGLDEIISATIDLMGADFGNVQLLEGKTLRIAGQRGFEQEFLECFREVSAENNSACGRALRSEGRIVIEDVETDELYAPFREVARNAGYRAVLATPLVGRDGTQLGVISTHFRKPHCPGEQDLRLLDLYFRQAADFIERCKSEERHRQMLSLMHAGVYTCDAFGTITYFNEQAVKLWGRRPKIGDTDERFCGSEQMILPDGTPLAHEDCPMAVALREGESFRNTEVNIRRPDDSVITVLVNIDPTRNERGEITGAINTFHDVSAIKEAEKALVESEAARRFAMEAAGAGSWSWDAATNAVSWSRETYALFGIDPKTKLVYESWRNSLHPDDRQRAESAVLHAMEVGSDLEVEYRVQHPSRGLRWLNSLGRVLDPYHRPGYMTGISMDITERKLAEQDAQFLADLAERIRSADDPERLVLEVTGAIGDYLSLNRCFLVQIGEEDDRVTVIADHYAVVPSLVGEYKLSDYPEYVVSDAHEGRVSIVTDSKTDPRTADFFEASYEPLELRAHVNVPLLRNGTWVGLFCAISSDPRKWRPREVSLLEAVAERTWNAVEKLRAHRELLESEERFARFMQYLPGLAWIKDTDGRYVFVNDAAAGAFGATAKEIYGKRDDELFPKDTAARFRENDKRALESGECIFEEERLLQDDGVLHYSLVNKFPIPAPDGRAALVGGMAVDITERKRAEQAVRESEEQFRMVADNMAQLAWTCDELGNATWYNKRWIEYTGVDFEGMKGLGWTAVNHPDHVDRVVASIERSAKSGEPWEDTFPLKGADGNYRWFLSRAVPIRDLDGNIIRWFGTNTDVTELREAQEALSLSEQHATRALEYAHATLRTSPIPLIVLDGELRVMTANDAFYDTFDVDPDETVGSFVYDLGNGQWDIPRVRELLEKILPEQSAFSGFEVRHDFESIGSRTMILNARRLDRDPEMPDRIVLVIEDVTDRLAAEKAVRDREMLQRLVAAQEDERKRLALDLHDDLGQELTALRLALDAIGRKLEPGSDLRSKFDVLEAIALDIDERVDRMAWEFRPAVLDQFGLIPAIERFIDRWQTHTDIDCDIVVRSYPDRRYGQEIETHLYRIVQETFNNIAKHAEAKSVSVVIDERRGRLTLIVEDDGKGFEQDAGTAAYGMGLAGMSERAALISGTLEVESTPGQGTTIYISVPVSQAMPAANA